MVLERIFEEAEGEGRGALIGYLTCGHPGLEETVSLARALRDGGVDILELGVPFSEPIADGPTIQKAVDEALRAGTTPWDCLEVAEEVSEFVPVVLLCYYNTLHANGFERYLSAAAEAGVSGIIVADMPVEESDEVHSVARDLEIDVIYLVAPSTTDERLKKIGERASGFVYVISRYGITGARRDLSEDTLELVRWVRDHVDVPVAVGFGISERWHVEEVIAAGADGAIVGSAFIKEIHRSEDIAEAEERVRELAKELVEGARDGYRRRSSSE
ncbi:TPA: tryptophan synthase subunit alpha [Methanopyrus kandleri]|uniref:Tryptophan synthase alpha chain n=1 Tax=Methanopyrus kandleri TaxID=2320 RepID=A0A832T1Z6_9EURY|nr:tryptophan synthase subunit alpha [Methanopyrus kandleri]HII70440.1 tryptophan synthase subunit alpha [Methanopyrus kandleri]